jgi:ribonuclease HII
MRPSASRIVVGVDEVGRGPLAGPVVAAAVILERPLAGIRDSKILARAERERLALALQPVARIGLAAASVAEIDRLNILQASLLAMRRAIIRLGLWPDLVLVDGDRVPDLPCPVEAVPAGDRDVPAIGAASIVAKVARDRLMRRLALRHPGYGWETNAGYPTREHRDALARLGVSSHHRRSFAPVRAKLLASIDETVPLADCDAPSPAPRTRCRTNRIPE